MSSQQLGTLLPKVLLTFPSIFLSQSCHHTGWAQCETTQNQKANTPEVSEHSAREPALTTKADFRATPGRTQDPPGACSAEVKMGDPPRASDEKITALVNEGERPGRYLSRSSSTLKRMSQNGLDGDGFGFLVTFFFFFNARYCISFSLRLHNPLIFRF